MAFSLLMVMEGIWPFVSPSGMRRALLMIANQDDRSLRLMGLASMVAGVLMLYLIR